MPRLLHDYHAKRDFARTPEPAGGEGSDQLRFVVQKHDATALHYDFRLEMGGVMKSWAIPKGPSLNPKDKHLAVMTEDHPLDYQYFEGLIPEGNYGAGPVIIWDQGTYEPLYATENRDENDQLALTGVHNQHLTFILHGEKLNGEFALVKIAHAEEKAAWLLIKAHKDKFISTKDLTKQNRSVITGRTIEEVASEKPITKLNFGLKGLPKTPPPATFQPMLATLTEAPFNNPDWLFEVKWDGYRIMAETSPHTVTLHSRNNQDYTERFSAAAADLSPLKVPALIDGEMTVVDARGRTDFQDLQAYIHTGVGQLIYNAFDLLYVDSYNLTDLPLSTRKLLLKRLLGLLHGPHIKYSEHFKAQGVPLFEAARKQNLEGLMAKRADSLYHPNTRSRDWLKIKTHLRQEVVIIGYTDPRESRQYFGALVLGLYDDDHNLIFTGHTGSGFSDEVLRDLFNRLQPLVTSDCPITPTPKTNEPAHWVTPKLVCEVEFTEWTADGSMRHPIFMGLREDKLATDVHLEISVSSQTKGKAMQPQKPETPPQTSSDKTLELNGHTIQLTHTGKVYWPKERITKGQLLDYYAEVAPLILPYLKDRPESLKRYPDGIAGPNFYQKDMAGHAPSWAKTITIHSTGEDHDIEYLLCQDEAALLYMINLGCIDINPWNSRTGNLDNPDWCVIDLDPEATTFSSVVKTAQAVHAFLDELDIPSYPKTSGATGLHIYIPTGAKYTHDQVKMFAELIARNVHKRTPDLTSVERSPTKRQGKIYLDFLQNRHGQTLAAPYSARPRPHATVSTPLHWDEVKPGLKPIQFTIENAPARFKTVGDLWKPVLGPGIDIARILKMLENPTS